VEVSENIAVPPTAPVSDPLVAEPDKSSSVAKAAIEGRITMAASSARLRIRALFNAFFMYGGFMVIFLFVGKSAKFEQTSGCLVNQKIVIFATFHTIHGSRRFTRGIIISPQLDGTGKFKA
jgi:hypothetical protein